jgi:hypothetical protein
MLLNVSIFAWYGAVCPWYSFAHNNVIPIYRLIFIAILVLMFRRLPIVLIMHKRIHQIEEWKQAFFVGFFGPMGVSAIFYLYISREFLLQITYQNHERADAERLGEVFNVVVWFVVICSVVRPSSSCMLLLLPQTYAQGVHGLSIPLGKLGFLLPRTLSRTKSTDRDEPDLPPVRDAITNEERTLEAGLKRRIHVDNDMNQTGQEENAGVPVARKVGRIGDSPLEGINLSNEETSKAGARHGQEEQDA